MLCPPPVLHPRGSQPNRASPPAVAGVKAVLLYWCASRGKQFYCFPLFVSTPRKVTQWEVVCIGPLVALLNLQKLLACFMWVSSSSLVTLIMRDKVTPLPLKHLSFQAGVQGTCSSKPVARWWHCLALLKGFGAWYWGWGDPPARGAVLGFGSNALGAQQGGEEA